MASSFSTRSQSGPSPALTTLTIESETPITATSGRSKCATFMMKTKIFAPEHLFSTRCLSLGQQSSVDPKCALHHRQLSPHKLQLCYKGISRRHILPKKRFLSPIENICYFGRIRYVTHLPFPCFRHNTCPSSLNCLHLDE